MAKCSLSSVTVWGMIIPMMEQIALGAFPQGLKPIEFLPLMAGLKPRPFKTLYLGVRRWVQDEVADVADDGLRGVARVGGELLPSGVGAEGVPRLVEGVHVGKAEHGR